jgi:hypothetical protein
MMVGWVLIGFLAGSNNEVVTPPAARSRRNTWILPDFQAARGRTEQVFHIVELRCALAVGREVGSFALLGLLRAENVIAQKPRWARRGGALWVILPGCTRFYVRTLDLLSSW